MNCSAKLAVVALAVGVGACGARAHISPEYGESYAAAFSRQGPPNARVTGPVSGLDSQEAAIISSSYLRSLAPKNVQTKEEPILMVAPPEQGGGYMAKLAPSVPKER